MSCSNLLRLSVLFAVLIFTLPLLFTSSSAFADEAGTRFPNTELITQDGKKVHFYDDLVKGKIVAIDFIYTTCQYACPLETARMTQVQKKLGDRVGSDIFFYSISIDPEHDTPAVLKAYMEKFHVAPGWTFLTGQKNEIDLLMKKLGVYNDPSVSADGHLPHLLIGNDATNTWIRANALDNPAFQARMIGEFLDNFKHTDLKAEQQKKSGDGKAIANFDRGKYVFVRDCSACHTVGHGDKVGPDLLRVTSARDHQWLVRMIQQPEQLLNSNDPVAAALLKKYNNVRMPNLSVNDDELKLLLEYLQTETAAHEKQVGAGADSADANTTKASDGSRGTARPN
jgi:protein SCO1